MRHFLLASFPKFVRQNQSAVNKSVLESTDFDEALQANTEVQRSITEFNSKYSGKVEREKMLSLIKKSDLDTSGKLNLDELQTITSALISSLETAETAEWSLEKYETSRKSEIVKHIRKHPDDLTKLGFVSIDDGIVTWDFAPTGKTLRNCYYAIGNWAVAAVMQNAYAIKDGVVYSRQIIPGKTRPGFYDKSGKYMAVGPDKTSFSVFEDKAALKESFKKNQENTTTAVGLEVKPDYTDAMSYEEYDKQDDAILDKYENLIDTMERCTLKRTIPADMQAMIASSANKLNCHPAFIASIIHKESFNSGFLSANRFEGHVYNKKIAEGHSEGEAKLLATSWGAFQVMGYNYKAAGYTDVESFVDAMMEFDLKTQLQAFEGFITSNSCIHDALKINPPTTASYTNFATLYNGPGHAKNNYVGGIQGVFEKYQSYFVKNEHNYAYEDPNKSIKLTEDELTTSDATQILKANGCKVISSGNDLDDRFNDYATTLSGIKKNTVEGFVSLKKAVGLTDVRITGGTEIGHATTAISHWNGYKLDIGSESTPKILVFATQNKATEGLVGSYPSYTFEDGGYKYVILDEGDHLDIAIQKV